MRLSYEKALKYAKSGRILYRVWGHVHVNRFTNPPTERLEFYSDRQVFKGKRRHKYTGIAAHNLNGTYGAYFTKKKQADKFAEEIMDGLHPNILAASREWELDCDLMDEAMGIDRGLGTVDEDGPLSDSYNDYNEQEYFEGEDL